VSRASRCVTASVSRSMLDDARGDVMTARHPARAALAAICTAQHVRGIRMLVPRVPAHSCPSSSFLIVTPHSGSTEAHLRVQRKRLTVGLSVRHVHVAWPRHARASPPRVFLHFGRAVPVARVRRVWQVQVYRRRAVGPAPACLWAVNGPCCVLRVSYRIAVRFDGCSVAQAARRGRKADTRV
jgi:hypothetical protein